MSEETSEKEKTKYQWSTIAMAAQHFNDPVYAEALCREAFEDTEADPPRWKECSKCPHLPAGRKYYIEWELSSTDENTTSEKKQTKRKQDLTNEDPGVVDRMVRRMGPPPKKSFRNGSSWDTATQYWSDTDSIASEHQASSAWAHQAPSQPGTPGLDWEAQETEEQKQQREEQEKAAKDAAEEAQRRKEEEEAEQKRKQEEEEADQKERDRLAKQKEREEKQKENEKDPAYCISKFLNEVGKSIRASKAAAPLAQKGALLPSGMGSQYHQIFLDHDAALRGHRDTMEVLVPSEEAWKDIKLARTALDQAEKDLNGFEILHKTYYPDDAKGAKGGKAAGKGGKVAGKGGKSKGAPKAGTPLKSEPPQ